MELVSVIVPVFNSAAFLSRSVTSVLSQTYDNLELILVNDGSTDQSGELCTEFAKSDSRIKVVTLEKNSGAAVARNAGLDVAKGSFIAFLDADDEWVPEKLAQQIDFMHKHHVDVSFTSYERLGEQGQVVGTVSAPTEWVTYEDLLHRNLLGCSTVVLRRSFLGERRFPSIPRRQDYGLWLELSRMGAKIKGLDTFLVRYHVRVGSLSSRPWRLITYNWYVYRQCERLSFFRSVRLILGYSLWYLKRRWKEALG